MVQQLSLITLSIHDIPRSRCVYGGSVLRESAEPDHGRWRRHVADPDGHAWEIA